MRKGLVYYTDGRLDPLIRDAVIAQLGRRIQARDGTYTLPLVSEQPGVLTMHRQILRGLENIRAAAVFMAEHDVLYHPSHFDFEPPRVDTFYYNVNVWHVRYPDGHAVYYDAQQVSGLCASRDLLLDYYRARIQQLERDGPNRHYEPGLHQTVGGQRVENWRSEYANLDIRHGANLTASKWSPADFRNPKYAQGWQEADELPGWGRLADLFSKVGA